MGGLEDVDRSGTALAIVRRHVGGLEGRAMLVRDCHAVRRHVGGLEAYKIRQRSYAHVRRHVGGLEE